MPAVDPPVDKHSSEDVVVPHSPISAMSEELFEELSGRYSTLLTEQAKEYTTFLVELSQKFASLSAGIEKNRSYVNVVMMHAPTMIKKITVDYIQDQHEQLLDQNS